MKKRNKKGFTLIELLIVVAIIGIIVAIAIPNLLNAIQRAKQKRTMGDMRSVGTAAEAYAVDFNRYPAAAGYTLPVGLQLSRRRRSATVGDLGLQRSGHADLHPGPAPHGRLELVLPVRRRRPSQDYVIVSNGKDGATEAPPIVRRDDGLQQRHHLRRRPVRSVPRGRAEVIVLPLRPDPEEPPRRGLFSFPGRRIARWSRQ